MTQHPPASPRKILSLNLNDKNSSQIQEKLPSLAPDLAEKEAVSAAEINPKQLRYQRMQQALDWLCSTFPKCFNRDNPQPLKLRIEKDVIPLYPEGAPFARLHLRKAIVYYVTSHQYRQAVAQGTHRVDLDGNAVAEVTPENQTYAEEQIAKAQERYEQQKLARKAERKARKQAWKEKQAAKKEKWAAKLKAKELPTP